jgi:hypothetical protein
MKSKLTMRATQAVLALALGAALVPAAHAAPCTLAGAKGSWAYSFSGSVFNTQANAFVPVATAGVITFDGHGNASAKETDASPAGIQQVTFTGTYTENPDCTGTVSLTSSANQNVNVNFYAANDNNDAYLIITSPGYVMNGTTKRDTHH